MKRLSVLAAGVLVVLMVHAWEGFAVHVSPLVSCEPDCTGIEDGGKVVNPRNCSEYYRCLDDTAYGPYACDDGNTWDDASGDCMPGGVCTPGCGSGTNCPLTCHENLELIGDAFDCSIYYVCSPDGAVSSSCSPPNQYFSADTGKCEDDESVCCNGFCEPYCDGTTAIVPDPLNCRNFFFCEGEDLVDGSQPCPNDGYFNVQDGGCVSGPAPDPCPSLCDAGGGGGDTSTTTTTTTTAITDCVSSLECTAAGNFAACSTCQPEYFVCSGAGASGVLTSCNDGYVFNPLPENPICVLPSHCPFSP